MEITIVCDQARGLAKASDIAHSLQRRNQIQLWRLSDEVPGIVIKLHPASACTVVERGGHDAYAKKVIGEFETVGYKRYVPRASAATLAARSNSPKAATEKV